MIKRVVIYFVMIMILVSVVKGGVQNDVQPLSKERLLNNLIKAKNDQLSKSQKKSYIGLLIKRINKTGVDFKIKPSDEKELRYVGATTELLAAIRSNYRGVESVPPEEPRRPTQRIFSPPLEGQPIYFQEVVEWLKLKATEASIIGAVYQRKVDFNLDSNLQRILAEEGGTKYLFEAIERSPSNSLKSKMSVELSDQAKDLINQAQYSEAGPLLEKAIDYDSNNPGAYRLRAELGVYQNMSIEVVRSDMSQALRLGGEASINVIYDCGGRTICPGRLFISKGRVRFQPDSSSDWELAASAIKEVKPGGNRYPKDRGGFIIVTKRMASNNSLTYNFQAYRSMNNLRDLIVSLINNNL